MCLEIGSKPQEAIPYCQNAMSICKSRLQRLTNEVKSSLGSATSSAVADKEAEIKTLGELSEDLERKASAHRFSF